MKTLIASVIVAVMASSTLHVNAQTLAKEEKKEHKTEKKEARKEHRMMERTMVSSRAKNNFMVDFANAKNTKWIKGPQFDEVTFTKDGQTYTAFYDFDSKLVGTTTDRKFADLPAAAQKEIKKQYKDFTIGAVIEYDDNEANDTNMSVYGTQFDDADHFFVTLTKGKTGDIVMVTRNGVVSYFKKAS